MIATRCSGHPGSYRRGTFNPPQTMENTMTTTQSPSHVAELTTSPSRARGAIVAGGLAVGSLTIAVLLLTTPWGERDGLDYASLAPIRDNVWAGLLLDGLAFAVVGVTVGLAVCGLVRSRGATLATIGAVLTSLGGIAFAMGAFSFASLAWHVTDTSLLDATDGAALLAYAVDNPMHGMAVQMAGFLSLILGLALLAIALLRAGTVPRALPISMLALLGAQFTPIPQRALDIVQIMLMASLIGVAARYYANTVR